ncbi:ABC-F family ATP-binding cassette domain-containing protein [Staphylococcus sp. EG-SA-6]|jgi:ATP-binding cassette subfamily F protein 3|uniref:ABC transporter ATP-binding protein n=2 Tax=Staphylococcus haemolyticus TaxID=1283 RepID=A0A7Z1SCV2_STAHA|nr:MULTISPECIES: ABC-F family ATP-binding cassette domain-containing protein [Staphylococcus]KDP56004.1 ABC transporter, ATP-binding protein [Staphylococcus aureus subsp. aureus CO-98]MBN4934018.1 ABC-F family ATP-binding cassette domain-containing protein [Staphylococcus sp. EG-SA-6]MDU2098436.1 ABC-F family ATP-binding cassette domain-containing protein [Staphylococcus sp.]AVH48002.1 ABC transporter ATP-binding protein [Staphylococcus haemolyticus]AYX84806.1 ABC transporter ATP-binding prote
MILLQLNDISKSFDGEDIFTRVNFEVKTGERIGVVGRNGAGKSTLMKIIAGVEDYDSGHISKIKNLRMGYLTQQMTLNSSASVFEEMSKPFEHLKKMELLIREETNWLADHASNYYSEEYQQHMERYESLTNQFEQLDGYQYESKIKTVLHGLNFNEDDFDKPINDFSGGQKTRLSLAQMLLNEPDLLLLDEPTNHLDLETTKWLEDYLKYFKGAIVIISHDRYFLDKIVTQIYDVALGDVKRYVGNYEQFIEQRDKYYESRMQEYERQQDEIKRLETFVEKNITRASTSGMAKSRRKTLEKMERIDKPMLDARSANIQFGFNRNTGNDVMNIRNLKIGYDSPITSPINIEVSKGDHIAIIGPNGVGKTTLIKTIAQRQNQLEGEITFGANLQIGYYDQKQAEFKSNKTIIDYVWDQYPTMNEKDIRAILGRFLFVQDDVKKVINDLSGGEKARLQLALLMLQRDNVLILDEPTNHLDIDSKEMLEQALKDFEGTILFVSHDRYFINQLANKVFDLNYDGGQMYLGDYQYYIEKTEEAAALEAFKNERNDFSKEDTSNQNEANENVNTYDSQKQQRREQRKLERLIENCEAKIEAFENEIARIDEQLTQPDVFNNPEKASSLATQKLETEQMLEQVMSEWENLQENI